MGNDAVVSKGERSTFCTSRPQNRPPLADDKFILV